MIAGRQERFAIEAEPQQQVDGWLLGRFRFWLCGRPVGDWDDWADLRGCVRWLRDFASVPRDRYEPSLAAAPPEKVFRYLYDPVMGDGTSSTPFDDGFARFHISHIGMSSFEQFDMLLLHDAHGGERCLWRRAGTDAIEECRLWRSEMERVAKEFCDLFEKEIATMNHDNEA
jgi:hypothetical protein